MNVWGYWKCPSCGTVSRGDVKHCPNCAAPIPPGTRFFVDPNQIEQVSKEQESKEANWICEYCFAQNDAKDTVCKNCASLKSAAKMDYFGNNPNEAQEAGGGANAGKNPWETDYGSNSSAGEPSSPDSSGDSPGSSGAGASAGGAMKTGKKKKRVPILGVIIGLVFALICCCGLAKFFAPVTKESTITGFGWERTIAVDEYKEVEEDGWSLPSGAELIRQQEEIKGYNQVIDHYEQKERQVAYQVQDGYDTEYRDLGNGQFEEYQVPKYKTEYRTEYYDEPVYKDVPIYDTKYYYRIGRWKQVDTIRTSGNDQNPYWGDTKGMSDHGGDGDKNVAYGSRATGDTTEKYWAVIEDQKGKERKVEYSYAEWTALKMSQSIKYKTFWFSDNPL